MYVLLLPFLPLPQLLLLTPLQPPQQQQQHSPPSNMDTTEKNQTQHKIPHPWWEEVRSWTSEACIHEHPSAWGTSDDELIHDEDGLTNRCALFVIGIRHLHHKIYGFRKKVTKEEKPAWVGLHRRTAVAVAVEAGM